MFPENWKLITNKKYQLVNNKSVSGLKESKITLSLTDYSVSSILFKTQETTKKIVSYTHKLVSVAPN